METITVVTRNEIIIYTYGDYLQVERHIDCRNEVRTIIAYGRGKAAAVKGKPDERDYATSLFWLAFDALESAS